MLKDDLNDYDKLKNAFDCELERLSKDKDVFLSLIGKENLEESNKTKILKYLRDGDVYAIAGGLPEKDLETGEFIPEQLMILTDGEYRWTTYEIYFFEKHDAKLCDSFKEKVVS